MRTDTLIILNLGAPLDYHLILNAGLFTAIYILTRAVGKIGGAAIGARISGAPATVRKYLGLTLMPHSGVSLVLTGIAISSLTGSFSQYGDIVRGTIAAAQSSTRSLPYSWHKRGSSLPAN